MRLMIFLLLLIYTSCAFATIYMYKINGSTIYSDMPLPGQTPIPLQQSNTTNTVTEQSAPVKTATTSAATTPNETPTEEAHQPYTRFVIASPIDKETFQNQPSIPVTLAVQPDLQKGDTIQLIFDGKVYGMPTPSTTLQLDQIERGQHTLSAILLNADKQVINQANSVTIFVHRASILTP